MKKLKNFLTKNKVGQDLFDYAKNMTLTEFYNNCEHGKWIAVLFARTNPNNLKELVLTAAHCANACKHLLKDERSLKAIDAAMNFESYSKEELREISYAAHDAAAAAAFAALWAARAALWAARAADAYGAADHAAYAAAAYGAADHAAEALKDPQLIADIVRKYLPLEIWNQDIIND